MHLGKTALRKFIHADHLISRFTKCQMYAIQKTSFLGDIEATIAAAVTGGQDHRHYNKRTAFIKYLSQVSMTNCDDLPFLRGHSSHSNGLDALEAMLLPIVCEKA